MDYDFIDTDGDLIEVVVNDDLPVLQEALRDSVSSRPPQGARQDGPSTYWIDRTLAALEAQLQHGGREPLAAGNVTYLQLNNGKVEARYDFDPPDSGIFDALPAEELQSLLRAWRTRVVEKSPEAVHRLPPAASPIEMPGRQ